VTADERVSDLDLRAYLRVLVRRKWVILAITLLAMVSAFLMSNAQTRQYRSTADLLFTSKASDTLFDPSTSQNQNLARLLLTEVRFVNGPDVRAAVAKALGSAPGVAATASATENVISISAVSSSPTRAADIANAYANAYIDFRRKSAVDDIAAVQKAFQQKVDELQTRISDIDRRISNTPKDQTSVLNGLENERSPLVSEQNTYRQQVSQLQFKSDFSSGIQIVSPAQPAGAAFAPTPKRSAFLAGCLGLLLGLSVAFLIDFLDDSIKGEEDVQHAAPGLPVLGMIPVVSGWKNKAAARLVSASEPNSVAAEAYRTLRTSIQFMGLDRPLRILQVTSPNASEGKTSTLSNLAVALSRAGKRVVVVGCDLRRPRLQDFFGLPNKEGFTSVLIGEVPLANAIQAVPDHRRLRIVTAGPLPPNPSELLSTARTEQALHAMRDSADIVLVDSPPVLPVTDAAVLSHWVDATVLVVSVGQTSRRELKRSIEQLRQVDATIVGIVLNGVPSTEGRYGYGYAADADVLAAHADEESRRAAAGRTTAGTRSGGAGRPPVLKPAAGGSPGNGHTPAREPTTPT
jgi:succinoglycan biosynthesis transport protein ExoP